MLVTHSNPRHKLAMCTLGPQRLKKPANPKSPLGCAHESESFSENTHTSVNPGWGGGEKGRAAGGRAQRKNR